MCVWESVAIESAHLWCDTDQRQITISEWHDIQRSLSYYNLTRATSKSSSLDHQTLSLSLSPHRYTVVVLGVIDIYSLA